MECGLERTTPRPTAETIGFYYPDDYGPYQNVSLRPTKHGLKGQIFKFFGLNDRRLPNIKPGRMLEIGCSSGGYMEYATKLGWEVEGIEFSPKAANQARANGLKVQIGTIQSAQPSTKPFNMVVGWMVLEHLHQPIEDLIKLRKWTAKDGYLVILVPDRDNISRSLFKNNSYDLQLPTHLFHFNVGSLKTTLENAGWKIEKIFWQRNCNTFIKSLDYWANKNNKKTVMTLIRILTNGRSGVYLRLLLSILMGILRQSGRIEVWATPINKNED
jgi:cyclopropane fatty-acyl-phospholipid synthase-like methyltransferase